MKRIHSIITFVFVTVCVFAQSPEKMSYQAVIRNSSDQLITNKVIGMQISILQGSASGEAVYSETQTPTTNANGLISIEIGGGTGFDTINWSNGSYFIKTETDPAGGTNYTITGTSQLLSVPYAMHAKTADNLKGSIYGYYIGQPKDGGIIYYLYLDNNGQVHGLIVSLVQTDAYWSNSNISTNAERSWDGFHNTNQMSDSPAKIYIQGLGEGWYIPSIDEINLLWSNRFHVNKALSDNGHLLVDTVYWTSNERDINTAFYFIMQDGSIGYAGKQVNYFVRAIRAF